MFRAPVKENLVEQECSTAASANSPGWFWMSYLQSGSVAEPEPRTEQASTSAAPPWIFFPENLQIRSGGAHLKPLSIPDKGSVYKPDFGVEFSLSENWYWRFCWTWTDLWQRRPQKLFLRLTSRGPMWRRVRMSCHQCGRIRGWKMKEGWL